MSTSTAIALASDSYLSQHPGWEPVFGPSKLASGFDLRDIGKQLIVNDQTGEPVALAGMDYTIRNHEALLRDLDIATAPFGGRRACGPAKASFGPIVRLSVRLPDFVSAPLTLRSDPSPRVVALTLRSSHNGKHEERLDAWIMRQICSNGAMLPLDEIFAFGQKHTAGIEEMSTAVLAHAEKLKTAIGAFGDGLRRLSTLSLDRPTLDSVASLIMGKKADGTASTAAEKIVNMVLSANGEWVPETENGTITALQVFEAATAFDRHVRPIRQEKGAPKREESIVRLDRMLDGQTFGSKAWSVLNSL